MRHELCAAIVLGTAMTLTAASASAITCHLILDRNDQVVYQDITPPVDLSDNGATARAALRSRGNYLMMIETDRCPRIVSGTGATGANVATVDDIVGGMRPYLGNSAGGPSARSYVRSGTANSPAPAPAATSSSRSTSSRSAY